jgi:non-homologous end joining protein Ku
LAASIPIQSGAYKTSQYAAALHEYLRAKVEQRAPEVRIEPKGKSIPQVINIMDALKESMAKQGRSKVASRPQAYGEGGGEGSA